MESGRIGSGLRDTSHSGGTSTAALMLSPEGARAFGSLFFNERVCKLARATGPNDADLAPGHEMNQMQRSEPENNSNQILRSLPIREIEAFLKKAKEGKNKPDPEGEEGEKSA